MNRLTSILLVIIASINAIVFFFWKGYKNGQENENLKNKSEALDEMVKIQKDKMDHRNDSMSSVIDRLRKYARTK